MKEIKKHVRKEFPSEFKFLDEIIDEPIRRIHSLEKKIAEFDQKPVDKSKYVYNPPGFARAKLAQSNALSKPQLEQLLQSQEKELAKQFKAQIWGLEPEDVAKLTEVFDDRRHPNPFENMSEKEFKKARSMEKDTRHSQQYMTRLQKDYQKIVSQRPNVPLAESQSPVDANERHSRMLNFNRQSQQVVKPKQIDEPEP